MKKILRLCAASEVVKFVVTDFPRLRVLWLTSTLEGRLKMSGTTDGQEVHRERSLQYALAGAEAVCDLSLEMARDDIMV